jgi:epoxyqueuosine reductase
MDKPFQRDLCGTCSRCLQTCPTHCILSDRTINSRNCISNLTIENKSLMPISDTKAIGNRLFGCDICQSICPWNRKISLPEKSLAQMSENEMIEELTLTDTQFKLRYHNSSILRAKRRGWVRNLCIVLTNLNCIAAYKSILNIFMTDPDPLCRASAARAVAALGYYKTSSQFSEQAHKESDPLVMRELERLRNENSPQ